MRLRILPVVLFVLAATLAGADDSPPRSLDPRIKIELFAENPQIVTPTGIDVDSKGRVWAIESNTHFPPEGYKGHPGDRVLVMSDTDGDGKADRIVTFKEGLTFSMSVAVRPVWFSASTMAEKPGADAHGSPRISVYIATRREIVLFYDDDGDDKADRDELIVRLESKGDYPHDGLAGIAFDALGWMYFGCGENLGADYKLIGSDGTSLSGGGEGGSVYRCRLDGTKLERWATGFWNPHASCFDAFGRLFTVDNDADSRPPCRLLHIISGGDYGYRYRNGRKGLHPFTAWNGEIPGTLPMVAGTGEAPSGILAYESDGLPEEYIGNLLVTSWGDHRIDRFRLKPRGASFESLAEPLIVGGENFRPVGIACAPDGSLYCTDWVLRDYNLHGRGRVWRISPVGESTAADKTTKPVGVASLRSKSLTMRRRAAMTLSRIPDGRAELIEFYRNTNNDERGRIEAAAAFSLGIQSFDEFEESVGDGKEVNRAAFSIIQAALENLRLRNDAKVAAFESFLGGQALAYGNELLREEVESLGLESLRFIASLFDAKIFVKGNSYDLLSTNLNVMLDQGDPFMYSTLFTSLATRGSKELLLATYDNSKLSSGMARAGLILAARIRDPQAREFVERGLNDRSEIVRRLSVQWIAEEKVNEFRPKVEALLNDPAITADLFLATLAALEMLDGVPPQKFDETPPGKYVLPMVKDDKRPPSVRALALRMVDPGDPGLDAGLLGSLVESQDPALRLEAVRTLQQSPVEQASRLLTPIATNKSLDNTLRAEAIVGLARPDKEGRPAAQTRDVLLKLLAGDNAVLRREALRSLRGFVGTDAAVKQAIASLAKSEAGGVLKEEIALALGGGPGGLTPRLASQRAALVELAREGDDADAGRRGFYHANSAGCAKCHTVNGRGGKIGPDLSTIGRALARERLVDSILEPGKEIAPQFVAWSFETTAGKIHTGMIVHENEGQTIIGDTEGKLTELKTIDIVQRVPQKASVMPEKLAERMTRQEFRDLLAFLETLK